VDGKRGNRSESKDRVDPEPASGPARPPARSISFASRLKLETIAPGAWLTVDLVLARARADGERGPRSVRTLGSNSSPLQEPDQRREARSVRVTDSAATGGLGSGRLGLVWPCGQFLPGAGWISRPRKPFPTAALHPADPPRKTGLQVCVGVIGWSSTGHRLASQAGCHSPGAGHARALARARRPWPNCDRVVDRGGPGRARISSGCN